MLQGEGAVSAVFCPETAPLVSVVYFRTEIYFTPTLKVKKGKESHSLDRP